jgi:ankyrin repeat protein
MFRRRLEQRPSVARGDRNNPTNKNPPTNKLLHFISERNWNMTMERLRRNPADIQDRHLFLHKALWKHPPLEVVRALHTARPNAIYHKEYTHGWMALHVACHAGLDAQIIEYLQHQFPPAIQTPDLEGRLPLHLAVSSSSTSLKVVTYLLSKYPDAMDILDQKQNTPRDYATSNNSNPNASKFLREMERGTIFWNAKEWDDPTGCPLGAFIYRQNWEDAMERLLSFPEESLLWSVQSENRYLPIHYACMQHAPIELVQELTEIHPYSLALTCQEEDRTALHIACDRQAPYPLIQILLDVYANAASHRDDTGSLPIDLVWSQARKNATTNFSSSSSSPNWAVVEALLRAFPQGSKETTNNLQTQMTSIQAE